MPSEAFFLAPVRDALRAVATTVVPEAARLDEEGWAEMEQAIQTQLAGRPEGLRRQLRFFVRLLQWLPILRYGRRLTGLDPARRAVFLTWMQRAPVTILRVGFWGLRSLVFLGYYGSPRGAATTGYAAHHDGWSAKR